MMTHRELREVMEEFGDNLDRVVDVYNENTGVAYNIDTIELVDTDDGERLTITFSTSVG